MRILVAIANYGSKNSAYLSRLIDEYRSMDYDIDIVVLSNVPKDLGPDIEVAVGLPAKDPWSLPFVHKAMFAERVGDYDLFIYSEDDTLVTQRNIDAFLKVTGLLPEDEIAGFLRYEEDSEGRKYCCGIHAHFHWRPNSARRVKGCAFAELTNAHSACYILTREQLHKAINSGGYLVGPHQEHYDLLCTAATDPYTQCGLTKVVCISRIEDFLLHHLPNRYVGQWGLEVSEAEAQIGALLAVADGQEMQKELFVPVTGLGVFAWDKLYYEECRDDVLALVPKHSQNVLSVGCGWGATEAKLVEQGIRVVGIPLDPIIAVSAKSRGVDVIVPDLCEARESLSDRRFDCILFCDVLGRLPDPQKTLREYATLLDERGCVLITARNFRYLRNLQKMLERRCLSRRFDSAHIHFTTSRMVAGWIRQSGLNVYDVRYRVGDRAKWISRASLGLMNRYVAREILLVAGKDHRRSRIR
jgi:2-polyprenyl-3-methyl-5-hydroxy-6-metoxy-1,4-benzoquinol methylase